jgi:hypothetical protein
MATAEEIQRDIEIQRNHYEEKEMLHKIRYEDLINKFTILQKKINEDKLKDHIREAEMQKTTRTLEIDKNELEELNMYVF